MQEKNRCNSWSFQGKGPHTYRSRIVTPHLRTVIFEAISKPISLKDKKLPKREKEGRGERNGPGVSSLDETETPQGWRKIDVVLKVQHLLLELFYLLSFLELSLESRKTSPGLSQVKSRKK